MAAEMPKIQDYAIVSNGRSAALFSKRRSMIASAGRDLIAVQSSPQSSTKHVAGYWSVRPGAYEVSL
jgi:hypothetical protein